MNTVHVDDLTRADFSEYEGKIAAAWQQRADEYDQFIHPKPYVQTDTQTDSRDIKTMRPSELQKLVAELEMLGCILDFLHTSDEDKPESVTDITRQRITSNHRNIGSYVPSPDDFDNVLRDAGEVVTSLIHQ